MSSGAGKDGSFKPVQAAQQQSQPGAEIDMNPTSEATKLEGEGSFVEYKGVGKLRNKKVIITGGDSGIGRSVAILMAREGADSTIVYLPEEQDDANATKAAIEKEGQSCLTLPGNLMDNDTCKWAVEEHVKKYGRVDVLVNNASKQMMTKDFAEIDLDAVESTFRSNILQMIAISKASSISSREARRVRFSHKIQIDYAATKGAIVSFTRSLAKNLISKGIRVNAVAPGPVHTPIQVASRPAEQMEGFGQQTQLGRPGQPSEIAPTYILLASREGELYNGQIMHPYPLGD
ncbi:MAG: hypothetical protein M1823_002858 [Watsoniomyces obsoletus]|nr:MAG: hypothetical protein M1823_002858 [Watsoniomyces obsoletus]